MPSLNAFLECLNVGLPVGRCHLFEFVDFWFVPPFVKHDEQDAQAAIWKTRIPIFQRQAPAELAANVVLETLSTLADVESGNLRVIDFGSGTGGPIPVIETRVNHKRRRAGKEPIRFCLTDLHPNLGAWMEIAAHSKGISFIPQPVNAGNPPFAVISATTPGDRDAARSQGLQTHGDRVLRLFCQTFHHFDNDLAVRVLKSTFETSDAFIILELQERRIFDVFCVFIETCVNFLMAVFWFWRDPTHLLFTYAIPLLPLTLLFDGIVSCMRSRTYDEVLQLASQAKQANAPKVDMTSREGEMVDLGDWRLTHRRVLHTWPMSYMTVIAGTKTRQVRSLTQT